MEGTTTPAVEHRIPAQVTGTTFINGALVVARAWIATSTSTRAEYLTRKEEATAAPTTPRVSDDTPVTDVEVIANNRTRLLIQQFEGGSSPEVDARLEMLTLRLRRMVPRVTLGDLALIEHAVDENDAIIAELADFDKKYGL
jgi:hypothetical protein